VADLRARSIDIIHAGQAPSGAYVGCPNFAPYRYCWLRDGSFVADAMSRHGEIESAERFFHWCARVIETRGGENLHARYELDGSDTDDEWPKFQPDGYGLWLWALALHCERHERDPRPWFEALYLTEEYLRRHWREPCFDWWEEHEDVHLATLGCIGMGLAVWDSEDAEAVLEELGRRSHHIRVDASQLVLLPPFGPCDPSGPLLELIELQCISPGGGVWRNPGDTYYGGGEWLLLTAMLGCVYSALGRSDEARARREWIEAHATAGGELPEQVDDHLLHPERRQEWLDKWGPPPLPLLWSHAMYLTLLDVAS
jgi:GH15 family glucan-1,4-alpha-glucosidase